MPSLAELYDSHAEQCVRSAGRTDDPVRRAMLLKLADEWRRDAQTLRQSIQPEDTEAMKPNGRIRGRNGLS